MVTLIPRKTEYKHIWTHRLGLCYAVKLSRSTMAGSSQARFDMAPYERRSPVVESGLNTGARCLEWSGEIEGSCLCRSQPHTKASGVRAQLLSYLVKPQPSLSSPLRVSSFRLRLDDAEGRLNRGLHLAVNTPAPKQRKDRVENVRNISLEQVDHPSRRTSCPACEAGVWGQHLKARVKLDDSSGPCSKLSSQSLACSAGKLFVSSDESSCLPTASRGATS